MSLPKKIGYFDGGFPYFLWLLATKNLSISYSVTNQ
jgi:hypothetical protein